MRMTKKDVHQRFVEKLSAELESITAAVKNSISMATDEAHRAESKYDTFSLESSYLARGQAQRVEELRFALDRLHAISVKELTRESAIQHGSLVRLESDAGNARTLYFCPGGGGEQVQAQMPSATPLSVNEVLRWPGMFGEQSVDFSALGPTVLALAREVIDEFTATRANTAGVDLRCLAIAYGRRKPAVVEELAHIGFMGDAIE